MSHESMVSRQDSSVAVQKLWSSKCYNKSYTCINFLSVKNLLRSTVCTFFCCPKKEVIGAVPLAASSTSSLSSLIIIITSCFSFSKEIVVNLWKTQGNLLLWQKLFRAFLTRNQPVWQTDKGNTKIEMHLYFKLANSPFKSFWI